MYVCSGEQCVCVVTPDQWLVDKEGVNHRRIVGGEARKGWDGRTVISAIRLFARDLISPISPMGLVQLGIRGHETSEETRAAELQSNVEVKSARYRRTPTLNERRPGCFQKLKLESVVYVFLKHLLDLYVEPLLETKARHIVWGLSQEEMPSSGSHCSAPHGSSPSPVTRNVGPYKARALHRPSDI